MNKTTKAFGLFIVMIVVLTSLGCGNRPKLFETEGVLVLRISEGMFDVKTLDPGVDMAIAHYDIYGSGPGGKSFTAFDKTGPVVVIDSLVAGLWSITVEAVNGDGYVLGVGEAEVMVLALEVVDADVVVEPESGFGELKVSLSWPEGLLMKPSIEATLVPSESLVAGNINFSINKNIATYTNDELLSGYYELRIKLKDHGSVVWGAYEAVRILKGLKTEGNYGLTPDDINPTEEGGIDLTITPDLKNPIEITFNGAKNVLQLGDHMLVTAETSASVDTYQWYVNDQEVLAGVVLPGGIAGIDQKEFTFDVGTTGSVGEINLPAGNYRIDLGVKKGNIISSEHHNFRVVERGLNNPPVAEDQQVQVIVNTAFDLFLNAHDDDGDPLTWNIVDYPAHGTLGEVFPTVTYTPDTDYQGVDSFTFKVTDGLEDSNIATVSIEVLKIWFVDDSAPEGGNGLAWDTAFKHPKDALAVAQAGDEIWVAEGTYKRQGSDTVLLQMKAGVKIYGGFVGFEKSIDERAFNVYTPSPTSLSIFSYKLYDKYPTVLDGEYLIDHVVTGAGNSLLEGFTIQHGGKGSVSGGGMYIDDCAPTVSSCTFDSNTSLSNGGGLFIRIGDLNVYTYKPYITNCVFSGNAANGRGGGIYASGLPKIEHCFFASNSVNAGGGYADGGGLYWAYSGRSETERMELRYNAFKSNTAIGDGGGAYIYGVGAAADGSSIENIYLERNHFEGNSAKNGAGAYLNSSYGHMEVKDNIFDANTAEYEVGDPPVLVGGSGGGIQIASQFGTGNIIIWNNTFTNNRAYSRGGGADTGSSNGTIVIVNNVFSNNVSRSIASGIHISNGMLIEVYNNTFVNNKVYGTASSYGGALRFLGGIYSGSEDYTKRYVYNNIFWNNIHYYQGQELYVDIFHKQNRGNAYYYYNKWRGVLFDSKNYYEDDAVYHNDMSTVPPPYFKDDGYIGNDVSNPADTTGTVGDYHLKSDSSCIDSGTPSIKSPSNEMILTDPERGGPLWPPLVYRFDKNNPSAPGIQLDSPIQLVDRDGKNRLFNYFLDLDPDLEYIIDKGAYETIFELPLP